MHSDAISGGCLCGSVRYKATGALRHFPLPLFRLLTE